MDSSVGPRALSVALIAPSQGGSPIDAILRPPSFGLVRLPGSPASEPTPSAPDVIVVDLTGARSASDPAAVEVWHRRWSRTRKAFVADVDAIPPGQWAEERWDFDFLAAHRKALEERTSGAPRTPSEA